MAIYLLMMKCHTNADQNFCVSKPPIFWLSGIDQEKPSLLTRLPKPFYREAFILRKTNGSNCRISHKTKMPEARETSGITQSFGKKALNRLLKV